MTVVLSSSDLTTPQQRAGVLRDAGDLAGAQLTLEYALQVARPVRGEDDREVLATAHQLAALHREAGEPTAARRVLEEAIAAGLRRLPEDDPLILGLSFDLGAVAEELGNRHEARRNFARVVAGAAVLGADHWTVRAARDYLDGGGAAMPSADGEANRPAPVTAPAPPSGPRRSATFDDAMMAPPAVDVRVAQPGSEVEQAPLPGPPAAGRPQRRDGGEATKAAPPAKPAADVAMRAAPRQALRGYDAPVAVAPLVTYPGNDLATYPQSASLPRERGFTLFATVAAGFAAVVAVIALIVVLAARRGPAVEAPGGSAGVAGRPPAEVALQDAGGTITVTWRDPGAGQVSFIVAGGRSGEQLRAMGQLGPGKTRYQLSGLNPALNYCFTVVAVYGPEQLAAASPACTTRRSAGPSRSPG